MASSAGQQNVLYESFTGDVKQIAVIQDCLAEQPNEKHEARNSKSETISKFKCSNVQNLLSG